jgi:hypothetical protein
VIDCSEFQLFITQRATRRRFRFVVRSNDPRASASMLSFHNMESF